MRVYLMVRKHLTLQYYDQRMYDMEIPENELPDTITVSGMLFERDGVTKSNGVTYVAGRQSPPMIRLTKPVGRHPVDTLLFVRETIPHGGNYDDSHQFLTFSGEHIPGSKAVMVPK